MKEDYLKYLTTSDSYMGYPLWTTNPCSENYLLDIHHLWFNDDDYKTKGNFIKWNPSVKTDYDRAHIFEAVLDGRIDVIGFLSTVKPKRKDISFIKKEIPKFKFPKEPIISWSGLNQSAGSSLGNVSDKDMLYKRITSSLKLPSWLRNSSYGIISDPTPQIFDEFH